MTPRDLQENLVEIQSEVVYRYYDYNKDQSVDIFYEEAKDKQIKSMYIDSRCMNSFRGAFTEQFIVIEVYMEE